MKTPGSYRDQPGRKNRDFSSREGREGNYRDSSDRDRENDRLFPEDRNYQNNYDRNNRTSYEKGYNNYDRTHSNPNQYDYDFWNRESTSRENNPARPSGLQNDNTGRAFDEDRNYRNEGFDRAEGYRGRNSDDYDHHAPYWNDYYDASDNYRRRDSHGYTYGYDEDYEREKLNPGPKGFYSWGRVNEDGSKGNYGYYESYPSYGQAESYSDHERYSGKTAGYKTKIDEYGETDVPENRKPNIRDRRYW
jgi:hypothetical protein